MTKNECSQTPNRDKLLAYIETLSEDRIHEVLSMILDFMAAPDSPENLYRAAYGENYKEHMVKDSTVSCTV